LSIVFFLSDSEIIGAKNSSSLHWNGKDYKVAKQ